MKVVVAAAALSLMLLPVSAHAGERATDAALGAVSGAIVFGPVGAVAGALVGYTAGPAISSSWGASRSSRARRAQAREPGYRSAYNAANPPPAASQPRAAAPRAPAAPKYNGPPAQGLD